MSQQSSGTPYNTSPQYSAPILSPQPEQRTKRRRWPYVLLSILLFPLLLYIAHPVLYKALALIFPDSPPPDDKHLLLPKLNIPESENAYYDLERAKSALPLGDAFPLGKQIADNVTDYLSGKTWDEVLISTAMERSADAFIHMRLASQRRVYLSTPNGDPANITTANPSHSYKTAARFMALNAEMLRRHGKVAEAVDEALILLRIGYLIGESPHADFITYLSSIHIKGISLDILERIVADKQVPPSVKERIAQEIGAYHDTGNGLINVWKYQYAVTRDEIIKKHNEVVNAAGKFFGRITNDYLFQKYKFLRYIMEDAERHIAHVSVPCQQLFDLKPEFKLNDTKRDIGPSPVGMLKILTLPNGIGMFLYDWTTTPLNMIYTKRCAIEGRITALEKLSVSAATQTLPSTEPLRDKDDAETM